MGFNMWTQSYSIEATKHLNFTCIDAYKGNMKESIDLKIDFYDRITNVNLGAIVIQEDDITTIVDILDTLLQNYYEEEYFIHTSGSMKVVFSDEYNNIYPSDMDILPVGLDNQKYITLQINSKGGGVTRVFTSVRNFNFTGPEAEELLNAIIHEYYSG